MSISVSVYNLVATINMNAYHLRKTEVQYELKIRNIPVEGTAGENRKKLSQCFRSNTEVVPGCVSDLDPQSELDVCNEIFQDLSSLIGAYEGTFKDNEYQRIVARLWHLYLRVDRIPVPASSDSEEEETKADLKIQTKKLLDDFKEPKTLAQHEEEIETESKESEGQIIPPELTQNNESTVKEDKPVFRTSMNLSCNPGISEPLGGSLKSGPLISHKVNSNSSLELNEHYQKPGFVPVHKWGLQFSNSSGQSVGSFLQRVEELRRARGLTESQLFKSAVDLFSGSSLIWYRSTVGRISNWPDLCKEMKEVFQTPDYDDMLIQEIMNRRQGELESIDLYIASMEGLYSRLSVPVSEDSRLKQMLKNLNQYLQEKLCMFPIVSVGQLRVVGRKAELGRLRAANWKAMSTHAPILEPDLAYQKVTGIKQRVAEVSHASYSRRSTKMKCWNCDEEGHAQRACTKPRTTFCYGCGAKNVKKFECPSCCPKNA